MLYIQMYFSYCRLSNNIIFPHFQYFPQAVGLIVIGMDISH